MSIFKVSLTNQFGSGAINPAVGFQGGAHLIGQGSLDEQSQKSGVSIQRTAYITGPHLTYRKLVDGQTFTDCNYWKQYAYPQVPIDQAIVSVVYDDGSIYTPGVGSSAVPVVVNTTVAGSSTFATAGNLISILGTYGAAAQFVQMFNSSANNVSVQINGGPAVLTLPGGATQTFNPGDLIVTSLAFAGTGSTGQVQTMFSVQGVCNS